MNIKILCGTRPVQYMDICRTELVEQNCAWVRFPDSALSVFQHSVPHRREIVGACHVYIRLYLHTWSLSIVSQLYAGERPVSVRRQEKIVIHC